MVITCDMVDWAIYYPYSEWRYLRLCLQVDISSVLELRRLDFLLCYGGSFFVDLPNVFA